MLTIDGRYYIEVYMKKYEFVSAETGIPCSDEFNKEVSALFEDHPALDELLHIDRDLLYLVTKAILSGKLSDWDSREEIANCMRDWVLPDLQPRIDRAIMQLTQNAGRA